MIQKFRPHDKTIPAVIRFWSRVNKTEGCWLWTSTTSTAGYGYIDDNKRRYQSSVYSWMIHNGPVPDGLFVLHKCDNTACVNPDHLFLGTQNDNVQDCIKKGRFNYGSRGKKGEKHHGARVTEEQVRDIRRRYTKGRGRYQRGNSHELAVEFGLTQAQVLNIAKHKQWSHVK